MKQTKLFILMFLALSYIKLLASYDPKFVVTSYYVTGLIIISVLNLTGLFSCFHLKRLFGFSQTNVAIKITTICVMSLLCLFFSIKDPTILAIFRVIVFIIIQFLLTGRFNLYHIFIGCFAIIIFSYLHIYAIECFVNLGLPALIGVSLNTYPKQVLHVSDTMREHTVKGGDLSFKKILKGIFYGKVNDASVSMEEELLKQRIIREDREQELDNQLDQVQKSRQALKEIEKGTTKGENRLAYLELRKSFRRTFSRNQRELDSPSLEDRSQMHEITLDEIEEMLLRSKDELRYMYRGSCYNIMNSIPNDKNLRDFNPTKRYLESIRTNEDLGDPGTDN